MADTLLLNTDGSPSSMLPLSVITWRKAIEYLVLDKVSVLVWHDDWEVHSANWSTKVPSVIMLKEYSKKKVHVRFSKANLFLRDEYTCQYCFTPVTGKTATLDHVLPISKGGKTNWENSTTACGPCNGAKGNDAKIKPSKAPHKPSYWELVEKRKKMKFDYRHPSWEIFLS
jgi:5-methylcytosine-specific restriction endonuclease McrA